MNLKKFTAFEEVEPDAYSWAQDAAIIGQIVIDRIPSREHLKDASVGYLFRSHEVSSKGRVEAATAHLASQLITGGGGKYWNNMLQLKIIEICGSQPDFIVLIDRHIWAGLDLEQRVALIHHELMHCEQERDEFGALKFNRVTGLPIWRIQGHDVEEFREVVEMHGVWNQELAEFVTAAINGVSADITPAASIVKECEAALAT
jgi:hypothetical protein